MPLHSIQSLPSGALLGRWHLLEGPTDLWPQLAHATAYAPLLPARALGPRQAQWLAGRLLVQHLLHAAGYPPVPLHNNEAGRPYLTGPAPQPSISLSHAGAWVVALLAAPGTPVGLDVETVRDKAQRIARKFLNDTELAATQRLAEALPADITLLYTTLWSAKETLFKLAGRPGIIFRENLLLDLPAPPWPAASQLAARLNLPPALETRHQICYLQPEPDTVLTYCVG